MKNQSAFPWTADDGEMIQGEKGMTLRDYFAAKVMQGMMANGQVLKLVSDETLASAAYEMADAMLKAREV